MEVVIKHLGFMRKIDDVDAALDVRIIEGLEQFCPNWPTVAVLKVRVANAWTIEKFEARLYWLQEQNLLELLPTYRAGAFQVKLTDRGREWAKEFDCQRQARAAARTPYDCMMEREAKVAAREKNKV